MSATRRRRVAAAGAVGALGAAGIGYAAARAKRRSLVLRQPAPPASPLVDELDLPGGTRHLDIPVRDGGSIHVADWSQGPPIVLLHGVTLQSGVWAYQFHDLGKAHRLIALDLRGHGDSEPGGAGMTIAAMADDVADVLEALDLRGATLVGHSMGGMAALRFCRRHPRVLAERVGALAIVSSAGGISPPLVGWHRLAPKAVGLIVSGHGLLNRAGRPIIPGNRAALRGAQVVFGLHPDLAAVAKTLDFCRSMRPAGFIELLPELVGFDERASFEEIPVPCVVVVGDHDRITPPRYARALVSTLPGAHLLVWPGAGHMLMYERRDLLDRLLDKLSQAASVGTGVPVPPE
ncbi:MAG: alpha/beta fold hydrolase [Acidimicrobiales bacterium]